MAWRRTVPAPMADPMPMPALAISAARSQLAAAVDAERGRIAQNAATVAAYESTWATVGNCRAAVTAAETAVADAIDAAARHRVAAVMGGGDAPAMTVRQARDALQDARDALEAELLATDELRKNAEALRRRTDVPYLTIEWETVVVRRAAVAVIKDEAAAHIAALVERVERLQSEMLEAGGELEWMFTRGAYAADGEVLSADDPKIKTLVHNMNTAPPLWPAAVARRHSYAPAPAWQAAYEALMADATARLPEDGRAG